MKNTGSRDQGPRKKRQRYRLPLVPLLCLLLSACGFHTVYGSHDSDGSAVSADLSQISVDPIPERAGQVLRNALIDRLNSKGRPVAGSAIYHLEVKLKISEEDLGTLANGTSTLAAIHAMGHYILRDAHEKVLTSGDTISTAQYDKLTSMYGTLAAHDGALERTVHEVSEQITARMGLYFAERPATPAPVTP